MFIHGLGFLPSKDRGAFDLLGQQAICQAANVFAPASSTDILDNETAMFGACASFETIRRNPVEIFVTRRP
jgi:hypothetical protein